MITLQAHPSYHSEGFICKQNCDIAHYGLVSPWAPGMPGTFPPPPWVSDPGMHHGTGVTHVP